MNCDFRPKISTIRVTSSNCVGPAHSGGMAGSSGSEFWLDPSVPVPSVLAPPPQPRSVPECEWADPLSAQLPWPCPGEEPESIWDLQREIEHWREHEWVGDSDVASTAEEASLDLTNYLLEKLNSGKMFATDVCKIASWCEIGGMKGAIVTLAKRSGLPTSHYNRHLQKVQGLSGEGETLATLHIPSTDSSDGSRISYPLPVIPPFELLNREMAEEKAKLDEVLAAAIRDNLVPPVYTSHPVAVASQMKAHPLVLYMDGVPTTKRDGVLGIWLSFTLSPKRHLCCVLKKSRLCQCGCRGWCTLFVIFSWLNWSLVHCATGENPNTQWDGSAFTDHIRLGLVGTSLLFSACLCAIKGDWLEFTSSFAFSNWATKASPCYGCWATKANYLADQRFDVGSTEIWPDFTMQDYEEACQLCEVFENVTSMTVLRAIRGSLFYDRRKGTSGGAGRCLRLPVAGTRLIKGDRLEPSASLPDIAGIDKLVASDLPVTLTFWRALQQRVKHRNPLFNLLIGVLPFLMVPDQLHCLNLGAMQRFAQELMWIMLWSSVWTDRAKKDQITWIEESLIGMRSELAAWQDQHNKANPSHKPTTIQKITQGHIGLPGQRMLRLKAAETNYFSCS